MGVPHFREEVTNPPPPLLAFGDGVMGSSCSRFWGAVLERL